MTPPDRDQQVGPKKAYSVELIARAVKSLTVYADSVEDAKRRARSGDGDIEGWDIHYEVRGLGKVRRSPSEDR